MRKFTDPLTRELFIPKRKNQRYTNRQNRIIHNSMIASRDRRAVKGINTILWQNRKILSKLLGEKPQCIVHKMRLISLGYVFTYFTHLVPVDINGRKSAFGIYEFMLVYIINDYYRIIRQNNL